MRASYAWRYGALAFPFALALAHPTLAAAPRQLALAWEHPTPRATPQALLRDRLDRPYLYLAQKEGGLAVLQLAGPRQAPSEAAVVPTRLLGGLDVMNVAQVGERLYLALGNFFDAAGAPAGLAVISVADPRRPEVLGLWQSATKLRGSAAVLVQEPYAYLGAMEHGVFVLDVRNPHQPVKAAEILPDLDYPRKNPSRTQRPNARGFAVQGRYLYVAFDAGGLRVIDIQDPLKPREVGRFVNPGMSKKQAAYNNLVIDGDRAYAAVDYAGLEVIDIRDPRRMKLIAWWNPWQADTLKNLWFGSPGHTNQIEYDATRKQAYLSAGDSELLVIDLSQPQKPALTARYGGEKDGFGSWGVTIDRDTAYVAYIKALIPFRGTWSGVKAITR